MLIDNYGECRYPYESRPCNYCNVCPSRTFEDKLNLSANEEDNGVDSKISEHSF